MTFSGTPNDDLPNHGWETLRSFHVMAGRSAITVIPIFLESTHFNIIHCGYYYVFTHRVSACYWKWLAVSGVALSS